MPIWNRRERKTLVKLLHELRDHGGDDGELLDQIERWAGVRPPDPPPVPYDGPQRHGIGLDQINRVLMEKMHTELDDLFSRNEDPFYRYLRER
jgi:hypothetical protein